LNVRGLSLHHGLPSVPEGSSGGDRSNLSTMPFFDDAIMDFLLKANSTHDSVDSTESDKQTGHASRGAVSTERHPQNGMAPALRGGQDDRHAVICYLQGLIQLSSVRSVAKPGWNLLSALSALGLTHRSCAVVSSSGILKMHAHGNRIDGNEVVMRFNDAPVQGYERLAGSKDMVRFENMHFAQGVLDGRLIADPQVIYVCVLSDMGSRSAWLKLAKSRPELQLFEVPQDQMKNVAVGLRELFDHSIFKGQRRLPTSGAMGMVLAASMCGRIEAYGMAMSQRAMDLEDQVAYHYYEAGGSAATNTWHQSFTAEKHLWRFLASDVSTVDASDVAAFDIPSQCVPHSTR